MTGASPAVVVWIVEGTWPACVDAAREHAPTGAEVVLLHVTGPDASGLAHGAYAGLLGRGSERDPGSRLESLAADSAQRLLGLAAERLERPCTRVERAGRPEEEVIAAASGAALLVLARDGDRTHPGPHSLGPASRFVVDHAPCAVLLAWPEGAGEPAEREGPPAHPGPPHPGPSPRPGPPRPPRPPRPPAPPPPP
jgi:nucleotide-binding universal stress UspA family protein